MQGSAVIEFAVTKTIKVQQRSYRRYRLRLASCQVYDVVQQSLTQASTFHLLIADCMIHLTVVPTNPLLV